MIDAGANSESKPEYLYQHAILGAVVARIVKNIECPKVAMLNIGTEEGKGNQTVRDAHRMLSEIENPFFDYQGYIEGNSIFKGDCDLVVCEGFVGNVVLKLAEGEAMSIMRIIKRELMKSTVRKFGAAVLKGAFADLKKRFDYEQYGGAILVGVNGVCTILHGSSSATAFANGLDGAARFCEKQLISEIETYNTLLKKDAH